MPTLYELSLTPEAHELVTALLEQRGFTTSVWTKREEDGVTIVETVVTPIAFKGKENIW